MNTDKGKAFIARREEVMQFIKSGMQEQGATSGEAIQATAFMYLWDREDIDNLYKCINSELDDHVIEAIVAHDFNGFSRGDKCFLPKSSQFKEAEYALSC